MTYALEQSFSNSAQWTFGAGSFFAVWGCPVHCRMYIGISGLYPVDASSTPPHHPGCDSQQCLQTVRGIDLFMFCFVLFFNDV